MDSAKTKRTFFFSFSISLFCPYVDKSFIVLQIKSKFDYQTVAVVKILINIVNILVVRDMHVERKDVVAGICYYVHVRSCCTAMGHNLLPVLKACKQHLPADTLIKVDPVHSSILDRRQNIIRKLVLFAILISLCEKM